MPLKSEALSLGGKNSSPRGTTPGRRTSGDGRRHDAITQ